MTTRFVAATVLLLAGIVGSEPLLACGEKFLIRSRGTRFQRAAPARVAASILIYANPAVNLPKALANVPVDATLRKAGYTPTTVTTRQELDTALGRGGWDLVLVDVADSGVVSGRAPTLPVVFNATSAQVAAAKKQHQRILKAPTKSQSFLDTIDDALAERPTASKSEGGPLR
jgi:hypothetical protein